MKHSGKSCVCSVACLPTLLSASGCSCLGSPGTSPRRKEASMPPGQVSGVTGLPMPSLPANKFQCVTAASLVSYVRGSVAKLTDDRSSHTQCQRVRVPRAGCQTRLSGPVVCQRVAGSFQAFSRLGIPLLPPPEFAVWNNVPSTLSQGQGCWQQFSQVVRQALHSEILKNWRCQIFNLITCMPHVCSTINVAF